MRKRIIDQQIEPDAEADVHWLNIEAIAQVELSSEDAQHPFESVLHAGGDGWRAATPGVQTLRLLLDEPKKIGLIRLVFHEEHQPRTQEFVLRYSQDGGVNWQDIARQQFNFSRPDATRQLEEYNVDLEGVTVIELSITPDISGGSASASLAEWRLA